MKVFDAFCFNDELSALETRLRELDPIVDKFILVEARSNGSISRYYDGSNSQKPLWFQANKERFSQYLHKIIHIINPEAFPTKPQHRNLILKGLEQCEPEPTDVVIMSTISRPVPSVELLQKVLPLARAVPLAIRTNEEARGAATRADTIVAPFSVVWGEMPHTLRNYRDFLLRVGDTGELFVMDPKHVSLGIELES